MNDLTVPSSTALSSAEARIAALASKLKANVQTTTPMITSTRTGKLKLPNDEQVESVDVVLLDFVYRNQYYPKPYSEGQQNDLVCQAIGEGSNDLLVPLDNVMEKQAERCGSCPKNQFGSHPSGSRGKACNNQLLLAVTPPDYDPDEPLIWLVKAQPTALKQMGGYMLKMTDMYGHPIKAITSLSLDPNSNYPSLRAQFSALNPLWEQHIELMDQAHRALYAGTPVQTEAVDTTVHVPATFED